MIYNYNNLPPFKWFVLQNFPFIEEDFDSITNWQLFCALGEQINKLIESVNLSGEQVEALTNAFNSLENYVTNYFNNLDIQEEINNKLDEMAEGGQLADIISEYLQSRAVFGYNTIDEMSLSDNLVNGSIAYCLGKSEYNDGISSFYKIRAITNSDIVDNYNIVALTNNTLVAERIVDWRKVQYFKLKNTMSESDIKKIFEINDLEKVIEFESGNYTFTNTLILKSNTKIILNDSVLDWTYSGDDNIKIFGYELDSTYTEYNGKHNIEIIGGTIGTGISLMHNLNIKFKNVNFENTTGHAIQIGGCKDIMIDSCTFNGSTVRSNSEQQELIQLETCTRAGQPWLTDSNSVSYDNSYCTNITIKNCIFNAGTGSDNIHYTSIGNHSSSTVHDYIVDNIVIEKNIFNSSTYGSISGYGFKNLRAVNNYFNNPNSTSNHANIRLRGKGENIYVFNNTMNGGFKGYINVNPQTISNIYIENNMINLTETDSIAIQLQGANNVQVTNNYIHSIKNIFYITTPTGTEINNIMIANNRLNAEGTTNSVVYIGSGSNVSIINNFVKQTDNSIYFIDSFKNDIDYTVANNVFDITNSTYANIIKGNINYNRLYQGYYACYSQNATYSAITNLEPNIPLNNFNSLRLTLHATNNAIIMKSVVIKDFAVRGKLTGQRIYPLTFVDNSGNVKTCSFEITATGNINYSCPTSDVTLRTIYGFNEI